MRAEKVKERLQKERTVSLKQRESAERSLAAEKMRLEVEMANKLRAEMDQLHKEDKKRERAFQKQKTQLLESIKNAERDEKKEPAKEPSEVAASAKESLSRPGSPEVVSAQSRTEVAVPGPTAVPEVVEPTSGQAQGKDADPKGSIGTRPQSRPDKKEEDGARAVLSRVASFKKNQKKAPTALSVKDLPVGKVPKESASRQRKRLDRERGHFMARVKSEAAARSDVTERVERSGCSQ